MKTRVLLMTAALLSVGTLTAGPAFAHHWHGHYYRQHYPYYYGGPGYYYAPPPSYYYPSPGFGFYFGF